MKLDPGEYSPVLGMSYTQFGLEGLAHQTSQGTGGIRVPPGHRYTYYKLIDSDAPRSLNAHEEDFFEGMDATLVGLASRLGSEESKADFLRPALESIQKHVREANNSFSVKDTSACAPPLLAGIRETEALIKQIDGSELSASSKAMLLTEIRAKLDQFHAAANEALGLYFDVSVDPPGPPPAPSYFPRAEQTMSMAVPGQDVYAHSAPLQRGKISTSPQMLFAYWFLRDGWRLPILARRCSNPLRRASQLHFNSRSAVADDAKYTQPYFTRRNPETETVYTLSDPKLVTRRGRLIPCTPLLLSPRNKDQVKPWPSQK